jgi:hypothetical protein
MLSFPKKQSTTILLTTGLILLIAALCYLLLARRFGFYNDDWYLMYGGISRGKDAFTPIFAIDRPFRGVFMAWLWELFGPNAYLYSLSGFFLRIVAAIGVYWMVRLVWPERPRTAGLVALLTAVYPGFLSQPQPIDYQSHLAAYAGAILSIALNIQAIRSPRLWKKALLIVLAIAAQVFALLQMEYFIGFEGLRFALLFYLALPEQKTLSLRLRQTVLRMIPAAAGALIFMAWRLFFFHEARGTTDLRGMARAWLSAPLDKAAELVTRLIRDVFSVTLFAWGEPFYRLLQSITVNQVLAAFALGILVGAIAWLAITKTKIIGVEGTEEVAAARPSSSGLEMVWIGLFAVAVSLFPINFGDRSVLFTSFNRFTLPGSVGACLAIAGVLNALARPRLATWVSVLLIGMAAVTQTANGYTFAANWDLVRNFWWQVAWRAPNIQQNTVIVASYANQGIGEDYFVWSPASMIYYPHPASDGPMITPLSAVTLDKSDIQQILAGGSRTRVSRGEQIPLNYRQALVLSLPSPGVCVHAIDGSQPEISSADRMEITVTAPHSDISLIQPDASPHQPPADLFGREPAHGWCYFYQKASLARQQKDWAGVARLGDEAARAGLTPADPVEWMPFIEAYAAAGREQDVARIAVELKGSPYLQYQACQLFQHKSTTGPDLPPQALSLLNQSVCSAASPTP